LKKFNYILILLLTCGYTPAVLAEDYIGFTVGQSSIDIDGYDDGLFYKVYGGIRSKYFGFEGSYIRLARFDLSGSNTGSISSSGIEGSAMVFLPLTTNFEFILKAGVFSWSASGDINGGLIPKNKNTDVTYGIGAQYSISEKLKLRAEYQQFNSVLDGKVTSPSLGLYYRL